MLYQSCGNKGSGVGGKWVGALLGHGMEGWCLCKL